MILLALLLSASVALASPQLYVNAAGGNMTLIQGGRTVLGYSKTPLPAELTRNLANRQFGDYDESPYVTVDVKSFHMQTTEVTNAEYEQYDPAHRKLRGHQGFSKNDDEAVVFVSWHDAVGYADWLSRKEGKLYRLPTEAEWEYACRAGSDDYFNTGNTFPVSQQKNQAVSWYPDPSRSTDKEVVPLTVAQFPPNKWNLHDMHGNVEEWTHDDYRLRDGSETQANRFKVTKGGSMDTELYYLRSANRAGALPLDRSWYIGFRVVMTTEPLLSMTASTVERVQPKEEGRKEEEGQLSETGFARPLRYVNTMSLVRPPYSHHNHDPSLAVCANGDVIAVWFSTFEESGRESMMAFASLRNGTAEWTTAELWWDSPDRMDNAPNMHHASGTDRIEVYWGVSAAATWGNLATVKRVSDDCGRTWGDAHIVFPEHRLRHMPVNTFVTLHDGTLLMPTDNTTDGSGGTAVHRSTDGGVTWTDALYNPAGGDISGIHGTMVLLSNDSVLAFGRGNDVNGMMAQSRSDDGALSWSYAASQFFGIHGGQRASVLRLKEGPILFCGFANEPMEIATRCPGQSINGTGAFCALSYDDGNSFPRRRLVSDDGDGTVLETLDGELFIMGKTTAEPKGYSVARQDTRTGLVHFITSRQHYRFTYDWLHSAPPCD